MYQGHKNDSFNKLSFCTEAFGVKMNWGVNVTLLILLFLLSGNKSFSQTIAITKGSYVINMGVTPQTVNNALRPYGLLYELFSVHKVPVIWSINPSKMKDGNDFSHNGKDYKGGTFIIQKEFRTSAVNMTVASWVSSGVVVDTTVSDITVPFYRRLTSYPRWALDKDKGSLAVPYFTKAGIPSPAYGGPTSSNWPSPSALDCCTDLFIMPHADPTWATHQRLVSWNLECKGGIWAACHAGSALENMVNPANRTQQANFLTVKDPAYTGTTGNYALSNSLVLWGSHEDGTPPYTYRLPADPVSQFMGVIDGATLNGSERIYIPRQGTAANPLTYSASSVARWNPGAQVIAYDPTHPDVTNPNLTNFSNVASVLVYGRGYDNPNRGYVMYEGGHTHDGTAPANIAAIRAFFNFSFLSVNTDAIVPDLSGIPSVINSGSPSSLSYTLPAGVNPANYTTTWTSNCGGTFTTSTSNPTTFTPPIVSSSTPCIITVTIQDACGRASSDARAIQIQPCVLTVNRTVTPPACFGQNNGQITMSITGGSAPYNWNWSRVSPAGTGSGTGTTITGLSAGTYNVTVTSGVACTATFTQLVTQPAALVATTTTTNYLCFGQTGAINLTVNGGTTPYTYDWADLVGTNDPKDRAGLTAGTYMVTVTDNNGCTTNTSAIITGPTSALSLSANSTNVSCNGGTNGSIDLTVSGGTVGSGYTYSWSNLPGSPDPQDQSGLAAGTYTVTVTDANGCTATLSRTITQPAALSVSVVTSAPTCPAGANPPVNMNGTITVTANGGTAPYNVSWTGPSNGNPAGNEIAATGGQYIISALQAGTYAITVTDSLGCQTIINVTLTASSNIPTVPTGIINN